jgi:hypothetical protein
MPLAKIYVVEGRYDEARIAKVAVALQGKRYHRHPSRGTDAPRYLVQPSSKVAPNSRYVARQPGDRARCAEVARFI